MTWKKISKLGIGAIISHKTFGECRVLNIMLYMGVVIMPTTKEGKRRMFEETGERYPLMEDKIELIKSA